MEAFRIETLRWAIGVYRTEVGQLHFGVFRIEEARRQQWVIGVFRIEEACHQEAFKTWAVVHRTATKEVPRTASPC